MGNRGSYDDFEEFDSKPYMKINMNRITEVTEPRTNASDSLF